MVEHSNIGHFTRGVINIGNIETFNNLVHNFRDNLIITTFSSPSCGACKAFNPIFEQTQREFASKGVIFTKIDAAELPDVSEQFGIMGTPTTIIIHRQKVKVRQVGLIPKGRLNEMLSLELDKIAHDHSNMSPSI